ncbi:cell wall-binding repeat-containing protein [Corynebacterium pilosum]|uniref:Putative lipoprotein n=1 Tax=Corynebacterium pilosum TaxID=35756 RepID=A0A376CQD5_9CORY|nr:cell wall-binding repeat-containing protein [Corynebacterium pilosum]STC70289.1 putative lipoprotein [Corynebacterium pilosum]
MRRLSRSALGVTALALSSALVLSSCSGDGNGAGSGTNGSADGQSADGRPVLETNGPEVLEDSDGTGVEVSERLFEESDTVVVASSKREDQLHAAAIAVKLGAPMLVRHSGTDEAVDAEIERLGADRVINVPASGEDADEELEATKPVTVPPESDAVTEIVALEPGEERDLAMPPMFATDVTSLAAAATANAAGADIEVLDYADPRMTSESMKTVTEQDTIALGAQWGSDEDYAERVELANNGELPGGGGLVFPGRRMIALYGHPSGDALGLMGEQPPAEAVERLKPIIEEYQQFEDQPVIPAFEIIVTVASEFPGEDGDYSNEGAPEGFIGYIDAITEAGGYAVLDLQPGRATFLEQAKRYEELLKRPNVGLAIDPEWRIGPDELPMQRIGNTTAAEINEVSQWLADLTRENNLPQKAFVVHQFQHQMVRDRDQVDTSHPELAFVLHADGHGTPDLKFETWNALREGLSDEWFMAWKNFIDEDTPTFTPQQTYETVDPRPWFVSYQ